MRVIYRLFAHARGRFQCRLMTINTWVQAKQCRSVITRRDEEREWKSERENSSINLFLFNGNTHCASQSDIMKTAPVILVTVHYHLAVVLLCPPLGVQVQQHFLSQRVHPHSRVECVQRGCDFYAAYLRTHSETRLCIWKGRYMRVLNVGEEQRARTSFPFLVKNTVTCPSSESGDIPQPILSPRQHFGPNCCPTVLPLYSL